MRFELTDTTWWQKLLLHLTPSYELAVKEHDSYFIVTKKRLFGVIYIIDVEQTWQD